MAKLKRRRKQPALYMKRKRFRPDSVHPRRSKLNQNLKGSGSVLTTPLASLPMCLPHNAVKRDLPFFNFEHILSIIPLGLEQSRCHMAGGGVSFYFLSSLICATSEHHRPLTVTLSVSPRIVTWAFRIPLEGDGHRFPGTV